MKLKMPTKASQKALEKMPRSAKCLHVGGVFADVTHYFEAADKLVAKKKSLEETKKAIRRKMMLVEAGVMSIELFNGKSGKEAERLLKEIRGVRKAKTGQVLRTRMIKIKDRLEAVYTEVAKQCELDYRKLEK